MTVCAPKIDIRTEIDPKKIIQECVCERNRRDYLLNILNNFRRFLTSQDLVLENRTVSDLINYAAVDLATGSALLSGIMIKKLDNSDPTKFYANELTAWIWAVDHSSRGDFNKRAAQQLVEQTLSRVDDRQIVGASDGQVHLLELGCAHGRDFHYLARKNPRIGYLGIDISPAMIKIAKTLNTDGDFRVGDILNLQDSVSEKQAAVFAAAVFHHFDDEVKPKVLGQIRNMLVDNGLLFLSLRSGDRPQLDQETGLNYFATTDQYLRTQLDAGGFDVVDMYKSGSPRGIKYVNALASVKHENSRR